MSKTVEELVNLVNKTCVPLCTSLVSQQKLSTGIAANFYSGLTTYIHTQKTPGPAYLASRYIYYASSGRMPLYMKAVYNKLFPLDINPSECPSEERIAREIAESGYAVLDEYLPNDEIVAEARQILESKSADAGEHPEQLRFSLEPDEAIELKLFRRIMQDKYLCNTIKLYLGSPPLIDIVTAWRLIPRESIPIDEMSSNALLYHIDLDRFNFLKLFVYLSDVDHGAGPHCYIPKTHLANAPRAMQEDRRYNDFEIRNMGLQDVAITGRAGTVILADTHCLHKGSLPIDKHRDIFQIEFTLSMFGAPYNSKITKANLTSPFRDTLVP